MSTEQLRATVAKLVRRSHAHAGLAVPGHAHTAWQHVEHLRLAAEDLVSYCRDDAYQAPEWPAGYWPASPEPPSAEAWSASCRRALDAAEAMAQLVEDPGRDPFASVPAAEKADHHTLRTALILLDHNGYHVGQLIALRRALGIWPAG